MRDKAAQMGRQCDQLGHVGEQVDRAAARMIYDCPAGDDLRQFLTDHRARLHRAILEVQTLQHSILREAADLEASQADGRRLLRQLTGT